MTIREIKPKIIKPEPIITPQCSATVDPPTHNKAWRGNRYGAMRPEFDASKCQRQSTVMIMDKPYCRVHGALVALDLWLRGELVEKKHDRNRRRN